MVVIYYRFFFFVVLATIDDDDDSVVGMSLVFNFEFGMDALLELKCWHNFMGWFSDFEFLMSFMLLIWEKMIICLI